MLYRIRSGEMCDEYKLTDRCDRGRFIVSRSGCVDSENRKIKPSLLDRGGRDIAQIVAAAIRSVRKQEANEASLLQV